MKKKNKSKFEVEPLDEEERQLMEMAEEEGWTSISKERESRKKAWEATVKWNLEKRKEIKIALLERDLHEFKIKSIEEGVPWQTLMAAILHKFVNGKLVEKA